MFHVTRLLIHRLPVLAALVFVGGPARGLAAETAIDHPPALSPAQSAEKFKLAPGLAVGLVVAEPEVTQPLSISFDDRGRMWVLQYRQYPNPNGLKAVQMDNWLRTKYDKVPDPPPKGPHGQDRISIYDDTDGDGRSDSVKHFIMDLNLGSGMALGYDGVFVAQPPYLLYYADRNRDDVPDGPPEVLLKGFGMEDAHAFANSLTFGPDGWLYGAQGSTATADIRGIGFQQGIWRYHPRTRAFELFSEGGGNTWGVDFDRFGNLMASGNTVEVLEHHVQGAYYVKGFGKHGPLHNPHSYGYFQPVLHHGFAGDSLTGGAIIYQGGAFPAEFSDACIAPNTRHSACRCSRLETRGSTWATRAAGDFITSDDIWFRPVDLTVGPDGAVYVADWYDYNISHSSPTNRSQWYQPSRLDGRVWRVAPPDVKPIGSGKFDLAARSTDELVDLLSHANDWYARQARRILAERRDQSVAPRLRKLALESDDQRLALQGLWSLHVIGALDDELGLAALESPHEYVRAWTVRLLGDERRVSPPVAERLARLAALDPSVNVRSQLACTAKRLPATDAMPIIEQLLRHDGDVDDVHIPLLIWWAIENKAISDTSLVLSLLESSESFERPLVERYIVERLARRFTAEGTDAACEAAAELLARARAAGKLAPVLAGMLEALSGRKLAEAPRALAKPLAALVAESGNKPNVIELALRMNVAEAPAAAMKIVEDPSARVEDRTALATTLGETRSRDSLAGLLALVGREKSAGFDVALLSAIGYFEDEAIADKVLGRYGALEKDAQARAIELMCGRRSWARKLVEAVDAQAIAPGTVSLDQLQRLRGYEDENLARLLAKHWGRVQPSTPLEKQGRMTAVLQMLGRAPGDAASGRAHFEKHCANCHKLHGQGAAVGPDLTGAERKNRELLVRNVVDPSAMVREQYITHVAATSDGRVLTGLLAESNEQTVSLLDAKNKLTVLNREDLEELKESPVSLMPENLLDELTTQQIRDLFAYLQTDGSAP
jgi:putative heme-binding domain-containing protein